MATIQIDTPSSPLREGAEPSGRTKVKKTSRKRRRSCVQWWGVLPPPYKFFLILICLSVLLVSFLYLQKLVNHIRMAVGDEKSLVEKVIPDPEVPRKPSASTLHEFKNMAVCSDSVLCSNIGSKILESSGNVVDAAIATMFCSGIVVAQSMGIGGGFVMNLYIHEEKKAYTLNAKEIAPILATEDMFKTDDSYLRGPLVHAVPGEVKGYWELHKKYSKTPWKDLIQPSIELCEAGFEVSKHMSDSIAPKMLNDTHLKRAFYHDGTEKLKPGERVQLPSALCDAYKILAEKGGDDFYNGTLADLIVEDLQDLGSIITKKDLESYKVRWEDSILLPIDGHNLYLTPPPTSGVLVGLILNILHGYHFTPESIANDGNITLTYHRIIEAFKYAFAYRTRLGDPKFENIADLMANLTSSDFAESIREHINDNQTSNDPRHYGAEFDNKADKGTSHISILGPNGDAISVTSSINFYFGTGRTGKRTGIIFNTGMNDFAAPALKNYFGLPASPTNFVKPQKRAMTSMSPTILTDENGEVRLIVGAAGGTKIITAVALSILRTIWFHQSIKEVVDAARIHHQLFPMEIQYEYGNTQNILNGLRNLGHKAKRYEERGSIICAIAKNSTSIFANADFRKAGEVVGN